MLRPSRITPIDETRCQHIREPHLTLDLSQQQGSTIRRERAAVKPGLLGQKTIMGASTGAYLIEGPAVSIDTEWDIELCELLMRRGGIF